MWKEEGGHGALGQCCAGGLVYTAGLLAEHCLAGLQLIKHP